LFQSLVPTKISVPDEVDRREKGQMSGLLMHVGIDYGRSHLDLEVPEGGLAVVQRPALAPPLVDPAAAVRDALENPHDFPALHRALTPDDHVAIVLDEHLPRLAELLTPVLEHLAAAHIMPEAITLLCPPPSGTQDWVNDLPDDFQDVRIEVHDPGDRRKLSYLATTKHGRRLYLNRTVVDADQVVVLTRRTYDPLLGYGGAEGALYPALCDETTRQEAAGKISLAVPGATAWPLRQEASEVAWLLGAPFLVQVIEGAGEDIVHVVGGSLGSSTETQRLLDARWRETVTGPVGTVVASISGDPARQGFADLAQALATASRVVQPNGRIILLTEITPRLGPATELLRQAETPAQALEILKHQKPADMAAAYQWASAAQKAHIYLLSGLDEEIAEELFATPLDNASQAQRLLTGNGPCLLLPDTHKALAVLDGAG
jgi:nickel-dependent lactate racemase